MVETRVYNLGKRQHIFDGVLVSLNYDRLYSIDKYFDHCRHYFIRYFCQQGI